MNPNRVRYRDIPMLAPMRLRQGNKLHATDWENIAFEVGFWAIESRSSIHLKGGGICRIRRILTNDPERGPVGEMVSMHYKMVCGAFQQIKMYPVPDERQVQ